jgi:hypothetical protein
MGHGLTLTETLFEQLGEKVPAFGLADWEVGRLVLAPEYRTDVNALRHCLLTSLRHGCSHSRIRGLYATCTHALSRLYRRFGFTAFAHDVPLPGTAKTYTMIKADSVPLLATLSGQSGGRPH